MPLTRGIFLKHYIRIFFGAVTGCPMLNRVLNAVRKDVAVCCYFSIFATSLLRREIFLAADFL